MSILPATKDSQKKERKKKPDELLASVVRETATAAAVELLRTNEPFIFPGGTGWVILTLEADAIGGLSKRHNRDEAKGSIIGLIESDQIQTVATTDMLAGETFGIIPTEDTLSRMEEYRLLTEAEYSWAVLWQDGSRQLDYTIVAAADFAQALRVCAGTEDLKTAVGDAAWAEHSGEAGQAGPAGDGQRQTEPIAAAGADQSVDDGDPLFDDEPETDTGAVDSDDGEVQPVFSDVVDEDAGVAAEAAGADSVDAAAFDEPSVDDGPGAEEVPFDEDPYVHDDGYDDDEDEDEDEEELDDEVLVADQDQIREQIARRFLSDDLDLDIRLDEFNTVFNIGIPVVRIATPAGASQWLGDQIGQLTRQANASLEQLHDQGESTLRTEYIKLMALHVEQVTREVATDREGSRYKALNDRAEADHKQRLATKDEDVRTRHKEILEEFNTTAAAVGQQAAAQAEMQYKERNKARVAREQVEAVSEIEALAENTYSHTRQEILRVRRKDAASKMQVGQTRIMELLEDQHKANLDAERELMDSWTAQIERVIDDHRKDDISRAETLAEDQARTDQVNALKTSHQQALEDVKADQTQRQQHMDDELERVRHRAAEQMAERDEAWQHSLNLEKEKADSQARRVDDLLAQLENMGTSFKAQYETQVNDLTDEKRSMAEALEQSDVIHSRSNWMMSLLLVCLGLVMLGAGFILGAIL
ncbi:hypothetical protein [Arthrobacter castelli]|uniref:hypothetical protein n=1 Tax=Arthrobacter castelli TaxID=271431 RepID=UPI0003FF77D7|nr:hypothetical protein [Arthrobacter castelli]